MIEENVANDQAIVREEVYAALRMAYDPLYAINVIEMGLVEHVVIAGGAVTITLLRPYPDQRSCADLIHNVTRAVERVSGVVACAASFVAAPVWDTTMMSPAVRHMFGLDTEGRERDQPKRRR